jgi:hypothetical protein
MTGDGDRAAALRADRALLRRAADGLRHEAIMTSYAGGTHRHVAFALALVFDELARHLPALDGEVRRAAVRAGHRLAVRGTSSGGNPGAPGGG